MDQAEQLRKLVKQQNSSQKKKYSQGHHRDER